MSTSPCECPVAGFCNRYQRVMGERSRQICQGTVLTPEKCAVYRDNWAKLEAFRKSQAEGNQGTIVLRTRATCHGPGAELTKLLAELGLKGFKGCNCNGHAAQMNRWGVDGCRENFATIRGWLIEAQEKADWLTIITAAGRAATTGLVLQLDPLDIAGSLVRLAIERAARGQRET